MRKRLRGVLGVGPLAASGIDDGGRGPEIFKAARDGRADRIIVPVLHDALTTREEGLVVSFEGLLMRDEVQEALRRYCKIMAAGAGDG